MTSETAEQDGRERRRHPRLDAADSGVVLLDGRLHTLVNWSPGGLLCVLPQTSATSPGSIVDLRLVVSADGQTVSDFDVTTRLLRFDPELGAAAAVIDSINGVAAGRFDTFFDECLLRQEGGEGED